MRAEQVTDPYRLDPDGVVEVPVGKATARMSGGPRPDQLFIATSREGPEPGEDPLAAALFRADVGVRGAPVREFAG